MPLTAPAFLLEYPRLRKRARDLWAFWYQLTRGRRFVARRMGYRLLIDLDSTHDKYILAFGAYEDRQRNCLFSGAAELAALGGPAVFLDIGSHVGVYSLWAHTSRLFSRITAIEADPRNTAQLKANLFLNDLVGEVGVVEAAASDRAGTISFGMASARSRDVSRVTADGTIARGQMQTIRAVRIDDVETLRGGMVVAKIDVEGHEGQVIAGMEELLTGNRCLLQIEVFEATLPDFKLRMSALGFTCFAEIENDRYFKNF